MICIDTDHSVNTLSTIKKEKKRKTKKQRVHHFRILEQIHVSFSREAIHLSLNWSFGLLLIEPLIIYPHLILQKQKVHDFRRTDRLAFCPPGSRAGDICG